MLKTNVDVLAETITGAIKHEDMTAYIGTKGVSTTRYILFTKGDEKLLFHNINELVVQYCIMKKDNNIVGIIRQLVENWVNGGKPNPINVCDMVISVVFSALLKECKDLPEDKSEKILQTCKILAGTNPRNLKSIVDAFALYTSGCFDTRIVQGRANNYLNYPDSRNKFDARGFCADTTIPVFGIIKDQRIRFPKEIPAAFDIKTEHGEDIERISKDLAVEPIVLMYACVIVNKHNTIEFLCDEYNVCTPADENKLKELMNL
jgi:hypothetical protein